MRRPRLSAFDIALVGLGSAMLFGLQVALRLLPNIEVVSLLVVLFTIHFRRRALFMIYIFVLLEGLLYGFGIWWFSYLYIWTVLYFVARAFRQHTSPVLWAVLLGIYGLLFGTLTSLPTFLTMGGAAGVSYIVSGFYFDLLHCAGNFLSGLVLFHPLNRALSHLERWDQTRHTRK